MDCHFIIGENITMNFRYYLFILFFICSCAINDIDIEEKKVNHVLSLSTYYYIIGNQMEINLNINIKYQDLVFKKNEDFFSSEIILHVKVLDDDGNIVYSHASNEEVLVHVFECRIFFSWIQLPSAFPPPCPSRPRYHRLAG